MSGANGKDQLWQTKLAVRLHDPAEKALELLYDQPGQAGATVKALHTLMALDKAQASLVKRADCWASAADRPRWPKDQWARVDWSRDPVLIHPVSGAELNLKRAGSFPETGIKDIKGCSHAHFEKLAGQCEHDLRKTLLAFWRFGPELSGDESGLETIWEQLPADTRIPDRSIWEHLDLTSAFAGAFAGDEQGEAALLALSIGPVQPFIASARSISDLWAGSHLLARLSWEVMRPIAGELGPDAILFPRLRGIPQVDLWLQDECGLPKDLFEGAAWMHRDSDANPLFTAALPNRFVAVVPASQARDLAARCEQAARDWLQGTGRKTVDRLLDKAGEAQDETLYCYEQMQRQLDGFPEVHWAAVPFSLIRVSNDGKDIEDTVQLSRAMAPFFGADGNEPTGFLASDAWRLLQQEIKWDDGTRFLAPNPGVLYPAVHELAERVLAAAKSVRTFGQSKEHGWRCSLTGETEWLTTDREQLTSSYRQRKDTLWAKISQKQPSWAKKGEHLGALPAIKRLWPTLFTEEVRKATGGSLRRFVVSTHTMALAHQLDQWLEHGGLTARGFSEEKIEEPVALPQRLALRHNKNREALKDAARLVAMMDRARDSNEEREAKRLRRIVEDSLKKGDADRGCFQPETYYGVLMMDGDHMGRILSGESEHSPTNREVLHEKIRKGFEKSVQMNKRLASYGKQRRAVSAGRHMAISGALNDFNLHVVPHVVQREYLGRLIYSGGDDVLAMLPVADLLPAAARLRNGWSGVEYCGRHEQNDSQQERLRLGEGYAWLDGKLLRMMGEHATASAGLVVAHHQAPLTRVLREVRSAEKRAKQEGGRNAFHIRVIKRSGGALYLTLGWEHIGLLEASIAFLRDPGVSRRAVYNITQWLRNLPEPEGEGEMLAQMLAYQFKRQGGQAPDALVKKLAALAASQAGDRRRWLENFLTVAEFLARESRQDWNIENHGEPIKQEAVK